MRFVFRFIRNFIVAYRYGRWYEKTTGRRFRDM